MHWVIQKNVDFGSFPLDHATALKFFIDYIHFFIRIILISIYNAFFCLQTHEYDKCMVKLTR